jgi:hypothetical protein
MRCSALQTRTGSKRQCHLPEPSPCGSRLAPGGTVGRRRRVSLPAQCPPDFTYVGWGTAFRYLPPQPFPYLFLHRLVCLGHHVLRAHSSNAVLLLSSCDSLKSLRGVMRGRRRDVCSQQNNNLFSGRVWNGTQFISPLQIKGDNVRKSISPSSNPP